MTKTFTYKFSTYETVCGALSIKDHKIEIRVNDRMEPRDSWKRAYAVEKINEILQRDFGFKGSLAGWEIKERR